MNNLSLTPAATVLLVRDCNNELEVLMVKRSKIESIERIQSRRKETFLLAFIHDSTCYFN